MGGHLGGRHEKCAGVRPRAAAARRRRLQLQRADVALDLVPALAADGHLFGDSEGRAEAIPRGDVGVISLESLDKAPLFEILLPLDGELICRPRGRSEIVPRNSVRSVALAGAQIAVAGVEGLSLNIYVRRQIREGVGLRGRQRVEAGSLTGRRCGGSSRGAFWVGGHRLSGSGSSSSWRNIIVVLIGVAIGDAFRGGGSLSLGLRQNRSGRRGRRG